MSKWFELLVGLRYLRARSRNRFISFISLISMIGIAVGVAVLIVVLSVMNGFEQELRTRILSMASHATISAGPEGLSDWSGAEEIATEHPEVEAAAPYIEGQGMLVHDDRLSAVMLRGILPEFEGGVAAIEDRMIGGELAELQSGTYNAVLGEALADSLGVTVGDSVVLVIPEGVVTPAGIVPRVRRFRVSGLFSAGMYEYDRHFAYLHLDDAARLYRLRDRVSGLRLRLDDLFAAPRVVREVAHSMGGLVFVSDWTRSHANFFKSIRLTKSMMFVILLMIVGVAAFNIISTLVMVVRDKQGDIAILRTFGSAPGSIMAIFMVQGVTIGIVGVIGGLSLGALLSLNLEALVHGLEALLDTQFLNAEVYYMSDLPARMVGKDLVLICVTAFALSLLSTIYPAWRAARTRPAEVLRYE